MSTKRDTVLSANAVSMAGIGSLGVARANAIVIATNGTSASQSVPYHNSHHPPPNRYLTRAPQASSTGGGPERTIRAVTLTVAQDSVRVAVDQRVTQRVATSLAARSS